MYGVTVPRTHEILNTIDQLEAWQQLLGVGLSVGQRITSPFRSDSKPNCYLRPYQGILMFSDHIYKEYNRYTVIHAYAHLHKVSYHQASREIWEAHLTKKYQRQVRFNVELGRKVSIGEGGFQFYFEPYVAGTSPTFTERDKAYWQPRKITSTLLLEEPQPCYSVHHYLIDNQIFYPKHYPCYALHFSSSGHSKLYCPTAPKEERFPLSTATSSDVWFWNRHKDVAIITKSYKDGLHLSKFNFADIYAFQGEGIVDPATIQKINAKYKKALIIYDNDDAGFIGAARLGSMLDNPARLFYPQDIRGVKIKDTDDLIINNMDPYVYHTVDMALNHNCLIYT